MYRNSLEYNWTSKHMKVKDLDKWVRRQVLMFIQKQGQHEPYFLSSDAKRHFRRRLTELRPSTLNLLATSEMWNIIEAASQVFSVEQRLLLCGTDRGRTILMRYLQAIQKETREEELRHYLPQLKKVMESFDSNNDGEIFICMLDVEPSLFDYSTTNKRLLYAMFNHPKVPARVLVNAATRDPKLLEHARYELTEFVVRGQIGLTLLKDGPEKEDKE